MKLPDPGRVAASHHHACRVGDQHVVPDHLGDLVGNLLRQRLSKHFLTSIALGKMPILER
ncbi:hypothetical protein [Mycobacterium sp. DL440]|uniref:hypothetical protein n=1 Tax=Mycobacterium sp. DL440 TaxID=2675523 RepID=UPI001FB9C217|nr:hypothetical protein [Mycobacterium sp. DL440]